MDFDALRNELTQDPAGLGYAGAIEQGSHNIVAALLNQPRYPGLGPVDITSMLIWIAKWGMLNRLRLAAAGDNPEVASIAEVAMLMINNPNISAVDFGLPDVQSMLAALVQSGAIPDPAYQELKQKAAVLRSRADILGLGTVSADDVAIALEA